MLVLFVRSVLRLLANHCTLPGLRMWLFRRSGIRIGTNSYVNMDTRFIDSYEKDTIIIGNNVAMAPNISIISISNPNDSNLKYIDDFMIEGKVIIKDHAYLGAGVLVQSNVTIGKYAVVGSGAVVTKDIEDYAIVVGNPAKKIGDVREKTGFREN